MEPAQQDRWVWENILHSWYFLVVFVNHERSINEQISNSWYGHKILIKLFNDIEKFYTDAKVGTSKITDNIGNYLAANAMAWLVALRAFIRASFESSEDMM